MNGFARFRIDAVAQARQRSRGVRLRAGRLQGLRVRMVQEHVLRPAVHHGHEAFRLFRGLVPSLQFRADEQEGSAVRQLVAFLVSDEGQALVKAAGYVPLRDVE